MGQYLIVDTMSTITGKENHLLLPQLASWGEGEAEAPFPSASVSAEVRVPREAMKEHSYEE